MSIFGDIDVDEINEDPFYVAPNTYWAVCTEAKVTGFEGNPDTFLKFSWTIDEPDNDYHGKNLQQLFKIFPGKKKADLTAKEVQGLSYLKRLLRRGFDLSESQIASVNPSELIGAEAFVTSVVNEGTGENAGKSFVNVRDVICKRIFDEEQQENNSVVSF